MNEPLILALNSPEATLPRVGGKGASLARMATAGLPVPAGFHLTTQAFRRFIAERHLGDRIAAAAANAQTDDPASLDRASAEIQSLIVQRTIPADIAEAIDQAYQALGEADRAVAVRSSATAEDLAGMSFAGQYETYLNVRGADAVRESVKRCWASLWTARALGYRARRGLGGDEVAMAVVVQELVPADVAGVLFTANPVTGSRDEVVINAAWGLGEAIVGGLVNPDTLVVNKQSGAIQTRTIADKAVMTVRLPAGTREEPVSESRRQEAALGPEQAGALTWLGVRIEELYGQPMDIEWALCDDRVYVLQARPITALPEPTAVLDWTVPRARGHYFRSSVIELLPDPLSPLFATLALPLWTEAMHGLIKSLGCESVMPEKILITVNDYAYYDFSLSAWKCMRFLFGLLSHARLVRRWMKGAQTRWAEEARPRYIDVVRDRAGRDLGAIPAALLLQDTRAVVRAAAEYYVVIQSGILPVSYESESLFVAAYNRLVKRQADPAALTFLLGFDSAPIQAEKSLFDLATWVRAEADLADYLTHATSADIAATYQSTNGSAPPADPDAWHEFCRRFAGHLDRFGHAIYDLDFAKGLAAEEPAPLVETLRCFLTGQARSPHERQASAVAAREQATEALRARGNGPRMRLVSWLLRWAQRYAPLREDALADLGLGWPLVRRMLGKIGRRLVVAGAIARADDVFWLTLEEVEADARSLDANQAVADHSVAVAQRRATWDRESRVTPPAALPVKGGARLMGIDLSAMMPARTDQPAGNTIKGQGASPGRVTGSARVIHGPGEFGQMRPGEILVAKITTPAWTPLFALAAGIVTDVGGPLSHSSIVAREYQIPAVLGTGVATERIQSGRQITVDGDKGVVIISE